jgi:hypothetical protein
MGAYQDALAAAKAINRAYGPAIVFRDGSKKPNYEACAGTKADLPAGCLLITSFAEGELAETVPQFPKHYEDRLREERRSRMAPWKRSPGR